MKNGLFFRIDDRYLSARKRCCDHGIGLDDARQEWLSFRSEKMNELAAEAAIEALIGALDLDQGLRLIALRSSMEDLRSRIVADALADKDHPRDLRTICLSRCHEAKSSGEVGVGLSSLSME